MGGNVERHIGDDDRDGAAIEALQPGGNGMTHAARDVLAERQRQIEVEGWTPENDDAYQSGDIADQYRREGAEAMRMSCAHAVNATASPIVGTPYSAGGRAFSDAIRAIDVDDVLARLPPAPDPEARLAKAITPASQSAQEAVPVAMSDLEIHAWIDACNHEPARDTLRHYLVLRTFAPQPSASVVEALEAMLHAVCGETGFAACVRHGSGSAYPWPALDAAEEKARSALRATPRAQEGDGK